MYPAPPAPTGRSEARTIVSLLLAILGLLLAMVGGLLALVAVLVQNGDLLNGLLLGLPAMLVGVVAYFLGKSAVSRINESAATLGGRPTAVAGWVIGAVATAVGATVTLIWIVLFLVANYGPPPT
jgi:hypothetical protein